jgi:hypothetical protein
MAANGSKFVKTLDFDVAVTPAGESSVSVGGSARSAISPGNPTARIWVDTVKDDASVAVSAKLIDAGKGVPSPKPVPC